MLDVSAQLLFDIFKSNGDPGTLSSVKQSEIR